MNNHSYVEASYVLRQLKEIFRRSVIDPIAAESLHRRIDNLQSFIDYLDHEGIGGAV